MNNLQAYWNASSATIPGDKDPSGYAVEKEKLFPPKAVVCDLGGGSGTDSLYFASRGHEVKLVDISDTSLAQADEAARRQGLTKLHETYECDMSGCRLPLPDDLCDVVYSRLALHYFATQTLTKLLAEIYRILKPGGQAYLTLKSPDDAAEMAYLRSTAIEREPGLFDEKGYLKTRFTVSQLKAVARAAGLSDQTCQVATYSENLGERKDRVKSGNLQMLLNEIQLTKATPN